MITKEEIANTIANMCHQSESDGAIEVGLWVLNNCRLSSKDSQLLLKKLLVDYDFSIEE